jgi:hypothetical protein
MSEITWVTCGKTWREFKKSELNNPGTVVKTEYLETFMIGHVNELGGKCDDCVGVENDDLIESYAVVWKEEEKDDNG